jgi:hypothetical protein
MLLSCAILITSLAGCDSALPMTPSEAELVAIASAGPSFAKGGGNGGSGLVSITPSGTALEVGESIVLVGVDGSGNPIDVRWSTSDAGVAAVTAAGVVTGAGAGWATITAKHRNASVAAAVEVTAPMHATTPPPALTPPPAPAATCDDFPRLRTVAVANPSELAAALSDARPGDLIELADGSYTGRWTIRHSGTAAEPVVLCGSRDAVLQDNRYDGGAVLLLRRAEHWVLHGFTVRTALWGIRLEQSNHNRISGLLLHDIGQEAVAVRDFSSHNVVIGNRIRDTGRRGYDFQQWGEAIYVGSAAASWSGGNPDRSDYNQILDNHIGPNVTAEHIDIKEGTTGGVIRGNYFDGRGLENNSSNVDAWVLVQGNEYLVEGNQGSVTRSHGFRVWPGHDDNWGQRNTFRNNVADLQAPGYGFILQGRVVDNVVSCGNVVTSAGSGFANVACAGE